LREAHRPRPGGHRPRPGRGPQAGVKLQIGFNRRFDPNFRRVHDVVAAGQIGRPHMLRITSRDPQPPPIEYVRVSGGIFLDMTIHDFDMARYLMGRRSRRSLPPAGVMVDPRIGEAGDVDTAVVTLHFENGSLGVIDNSRQAVYGYDQRVEVFGSGGVVTADNNYPNTALISDAQRVHRDLPLNFFMERYVESYVNEMRAFVDCVVNDTPPPVTGLDGRIPVVMGYAAKKSAAEGRVVRLAEVRLAHTMGALHGAAQGPIRMAVVGVGRMGLTHAENLACRVRGAQLVAVTTSDPSGRPRCAGSPAGPSLPFIPTWRRCSPLSSWTPSAFPAAPRPTPATS
jgi:predicted dehydrogenase